jgi:hypothetical protein
MGAAAVTDVELAAAREAQRRLSFEGFEGCPWSDLEGVVWPYSDSAPDATDLRCVIEIERVGGGWYSIPTADGPGRWSVDQCSEKKLRERFGGRRRYRLSLRWGQNTVKGTMRYVDLGGDLTTPRQVPGLPKELDPAFAEIAPDGGLALAPPPAPKPEGSDREPLAVLDQLLAITKDDPGLAILTASVRSLPPESQFVTSAMTFALLEHRRMMAKVMEFVTSVMESMATGRHAPPEVSAIYRDLYARAEQRASALAEQNDVLKQHAAGTPAAAAPSPYAEIVKVVVGKVSEKVTEKFMAGMTPEMMQQFVSAMGGA